MAMGYYGKWKSNQIRMGFYADGDSKAFAMGFYGGDTNIDKVPNMKMYMGFYGER